MMLFLGTENALPSLGIVPSQSGDTWVFKGRVLDRDTLHPIASMRVRRLDGKIETMTGETGSFAFPFSSGDFGRCELDQDRSTVICRKDNLEATKLLIGDNRTTSIVITPDPRTSLDSEAVIILWRSARLTGVWLDSSGRALSNRTLELKPVEQFPFEYDSSFDALMATTDEKGAFSFDRVPARVHWTIHPVQSEDECSAIDFPAIAIGPGETKSIIVQSRRARRVVGTVRNSGGIPVADAQVWLKGGSEFLSTETDADGSFEFSRVSLGSYQLSALYPYDYDAIREGALITLVVGEASGDVVSNLTTLPVQRITGHLVDAQHHPVAHGQIWYQPEIMPCCGSADVGSAGEFSLSGLIPYHEYHLLGTNDQRMIRSPTCAARAGSKDVELVLEPGGRLTGRIVYREKDPRGIVSVRMACLDDLHQDNQLGPNASIGAVEVDSQGQFECSGLPAGQWSFWAFDSGGFASAHRTVTIIVGQETKCPDLVLEPCVDLFCISRPGSGNVELDVIRNGEVLGRLEVGGESLGHVTVPAGRLQVRAHHGDRIVEEQPLDAIGRGRAFVGIGFSR